MSTRKSTVFLHYFRTTALHADLWPRSSSAQTCDSSSAYRLTTVSGRPTAGLSLRRKPRRRRCNHSTEKHVLCYNPVGKPPTEPGTGRRVTQQNALRGAFALDAVSSIVLSSDTFHSSDLNLCGHKLFNVRRFRKCLRQEQRSCRGRCVAGQSDGKNP